MSIFLGLVLATPPSASGIPRGIHDGGPNPRSWALLDGAHIWVCWDRREPECFVAVNVPPQITPVVEMGFVDRSTLVLGGEMGPPMVVDRGQVAARIRDDAGPVGLVPPRPLPCGPGGWGPRLGPGQPRWVSCEHRPICGVGRLSGRGRPTGIAARVSMGVGRDGAHRWGDFGKTRTRGWVAVASVKVSLSPRRRDRDLRARTRTRASLARSACRAKAS